MNKAKILASLVGTSLITLGGSFVSESAQAITLATGDFIILDIQFEAVDTFGSDGLVDEVRFRGFDDSNGDPVFVLPEPTVNFPPMPDPIPPDDGTDGEQGSGWGIFTVTANGFNNAPPPNSLVGETGFIRSFNLADTNFFTFVPGPPTSSTPSIGELNLFTVDASFQPLWYLDVPGDTPLSFDLTEFTTFQTTALSTTAPSTFNFSGTGFLMSDNRKVAVADFTAAAVYNPSEMRWETDGGLVVQVTDMMAVPEPGTIIGLLAMSGLGLGLKLKKQS